MKRILAIAILLLTSTPAFSATPESFADLVEKLTPAVVNISTTQVVKGFEQGQVNGPFPPGSPYEEFNQLFVDPRLKKQMEQQKGMKATSLGSGFIISSNGVIITNNHVVAGGTDITVTLHDDTKLKAKIIGRDTKIDVAVLKVEAGKPLPFVKFGNSDVMRVGDWVLAIGNPYGLGGTVTAGIISARARDINVGPFDDFLQTDAAINRGNSGGPMFNTAGEVVGINTAIFSPSGGNVGIGFATPSSLASPVIDQIIKFGRAKRAWLGVKMQTVTDEVAASLGMKQAGGALVLEVIPNSPASKAGLKEGDVITKFNGQQVAAMRKLPRIVAETEIGKEVPIEIYRNSKLQNVKLTLTEMTAEEEKAQEGDDNIGNKTTGIKGKVMLGMKLVPITPQLKQQYNLALANGLMVADVAANSDAASNGIRGGNIITKAGDKEVKSLGDLEIAIANAKKQKRTAILLLIESGNGVESRFVPVALK